MFIMRPREQVPTVRLIIQWEGVSQWPGGGDPITFQVILYETSNKILFQYQDVDFGIAGVDFGASATVGVQKDSSTATEYSCNLPSLSSGMAILFSPYGEITSPSPFSIGLDYDCHRER